MATTDRKATVELGQAIDQYTSSLVDRLRGFNAGADVAPFLARWVHDEDLVRSLVSMTDAAAEHGLETLEIKLDAQLSARLDRVALAAALPVSGEGATVTINVKLASTGMQRTVRQATQGERRFTESNADSGPLPFLLPAHLASLQAQPASADAGDLATCSWQASTSLRGTTWTLGIVDGLVGGSHVEGGDAALVSLVSFAATQLLGLPAREAREHGASRTEFALRGRGQAVPVKGILLPSRAGTGFADLQKMLDAWAQRHDAQFGSPQGLNEFEPAPRAAWAGMGADARLATVRDVAAKTAARQGLSRDTVGVIAIEREILVHMEQPDVAGSGAKGKLLMAVERALRDEVDPALVVTTEERKDGNKLRRLVAKES